MSLLRVFVDSDVIISSLLSRLGTAFLLINNTQRLQLFISNVSCKELEIVAERFSIKKELNVLLKDRFEIIKLKETSDNIKSSYGGYVTDTNDAHIVAGTIAAKVKFLISYNTKHFKVEKIKRDFDIIVTTPANVLQYLRSLY